MNPAGSKFQSTPPRGGRLHPT